MARNKDYNWNLPEPLHGEGHPWVSIHAAILMDIRDELKRLNSTIHCHNFLAIPHKLDRIVFNTRKKKRQVKK